MGGRRKKTRAMKRTEGLDFKEGVGQVGWEELHGGYCVLYIYSIPFSRNSCFYSFLLLPCCLMAALLIACFVYI